MRGSTPVSRRVPLSSRGAKLVTVGQWWWEAAAAAGVGPGTSRRHLATPLQREPKAGTAGVLGSCRWLGLMKAVGGSSINERFGDCSRLGLGKKLKSPKGRLIPRGRWFYGGGYGRRPHCPGLTGCKLAVSKRTTGMCHQGWQRCLCFGTEQGTSPPGAASTRLGQLHGSHLPLGSCSQSLPPRGPAAIPSLALERFVAGEGRTFPPSQQLEPCTERPPCLLPSHLQASGSLGLCGLPLLPAGRSLVFPGGQTPAHEDLRCCPVSSYSCSPPARGLPGCEFPWQIALEKLSLSKQTHARGVFSLPCPASLRFPPGPAAPLLQPSAWCRSWLQPCRGWECVRWGEESELPSLPASARTPAEGEGKKKKKRKKAGFCSFSLRNSPAGGFLRNDTEIAVLGTAAGRRGAAGPRGVGLSAWLVAGLAVPGWGSCRGGAVPRARGPRWGAPGRARSCCSTSREAPWCLGGSVTLRHGAGEHGEGLCRFSPPFASRSCSLLPSGFWG